jgi:hypothetical protein
MRPSSPRRTESRSSAKGGRGAVSQEVFQTLKIAGHIAVNERDPDACVHREPTVLSSEHIARRISVEEPLHTEPTHDTTAHLLGERGQISLGDRPSRQLSSAGGFAFAPPAEGSRRPITVRHEHAVSHTRMEVDVAVDSRAETVQEGDGARAWPRSRRGIIST